MDKVQILAGQTGVTGGAILDSDKCQFRLVVINPLSVMLFNPVLKSLNQGLGKVR